MRKNTLTQRLNIIRGQIDGLIRLVQEEDDCQKTIEQFYAINAALKKSLEVYLKNNLNVCLRTVRGKERKTLNVLIKELVKNID